MSAYYLKVVLPGGEVVFYFLDSTSQVEVRYPAELSNNPLANGVTAADNYVQQPTMISISGRISDIKSANPGTDSKSTKQYLDGLDLIRERVIPISVLCQVGRPELHNCYFTSLSVTQDKSSGFAGIDGITGQPVNAYKINSTLQQAIYARGVQITSVPDSQFSNAFQEKVKAQSNTQQPNEGTNNLIVSGSAKLEEAKRIREAGLGIF